MFGGCPSPVTTVRNQTYRCLASGETSGELSAYGLRLAEHAGSWMKVRCAVVVRGSGSVCGVV